MKIIQNQFLFNQADEDVDIFNQLHVYLSPIFSVIWRNDLFIYICYVSTM